MLRNPLELDCSDSPSMTKQSFKAECDIRTIMKRAKGNPGLFTHVTSMEAKWGDVSSVPDYQSALNQVIAADEMFMKMPAELRKRFSNDPAQLLAFVEDPKNLEESYRIGLRSKPAPVEPISPAPQGKSGVSPEEKKA